MNTIIVDDKDSDTYSAKDLDLLAVSEIQEWKVLYQLVCY